MKSLVFAPARPFVQPASSSVRSLALSVAAFLLLAPVGCKHNAASPEAVPDTVAARKAAKQPYTAPPAADMGLYPPIGDANADVAAGLQKARADGKRVILDFGGDWCGDCKVLDIYLRQQPNADLMAKYFVKVNVNIGHKDANLDLAHKYGVPVEGVPALAVLDSDGKVLYKQNKEFSDMRYDKPQTVTDFLNKWKS